VPGTASEITLEFRGGLVLPVAYEVRKMKTDSGFAVSAAYFDRATM